MITPSFNLTATERVLPRLALDFTTGVLDSRVAITRLLNTATRVNSSGFIEIVNANLPRFDYDPVTLAPRGLLVEEQRTNLFTYSEQLENAAWLLADSTVTANAIPSPDGTTNAELVRPDAVFGVHAIYRNAYTVTANAAHTMTVFAKAGGYNFIALAIHNGAVSAGTESIQMFNLSNGTLGSSYNTAPTSASITPMGNGWYRCSMTWAVTTTSLNPAYFPMNADANPRALWTGNGTSGVYLYGAQLEAGAFATSYIPTVASQVTRTADVATITGANFSQWYNQSEGTFVVGYQAEAPISIDIFMANSGAPLTNSIGIYTGAGTNDVGWCRVAGATQAAINGSVVATTAHKSAFAYATNNFAFSTAGGSAGTDTSGTLPAPDRLTFGANSISSNSQGMWLRSLTYYNTRLPDQQLQALTS